MCIVGVIEMKLSLFKLAGSLFGVLSGVLLSNLVVCVRENDAGNAVISTILSIICMVVSFVVVCVEDKDLM